MKKSQFEDMLFNSIDVLPINLSDSDIELIVNEVLSVIDKVGMTPPPLPNDSVKIQEQDGQLFIPIWGWEE